MRIITLEDHFATPMFQERFPQGNVPGHFLADRGRYLGYDISAELLNLGDSRLAAMDAAGIDVQVVSLTMPGCEAFDGETAIAMATDANDRLAEAIQAHPSRLAGFASLPTANPAIAAKELERAVTKLGLKRRLDQWSRSRRVSRQPEVLGNLRMCPGAERADLPASDGTASRRAQGLL